jgi:hypothetical protein
VKFRLLNNMTRMTSRLLVCRRSEGNNRNAEVQDIFRADFGRACDEDCQRGRFRQKPPKGRRGHNNCNQQVEATPLAFAGEKRKERLTLQLPEETDEDIRYAEWRDLYKQALLELDEKQLRDRIAAAETAISNRLRAIAGNSNHDAERQAIDDARSSLRVLKRNSI